MTNIYIWKDLSIEEEEEYIKWTLDNWQQNKKINGLWHPVVKSTWQKLDASYNIACAQIIGDFDQLKRNMKDNRKDDESDDRKE